MLKKAFQIILILVGGFIGYVYTPELIKLLKINLSFDDLLIQLMGAGLGVVIISLLTIWFLDAIIRLLKKMEDYVCKISSLDFVFGIFGAIVGLIVANLLAATINNIPVINKIVPVVLAFLLGYLGFVLGYKEKEGLGAVFSKLTKDKLIKKDVSYKYEHKILDTSVIIDGRIADICKTGFIDGQIVIPNFVLEELQHIADSADNLKRNRGRRGLDMLNKIRKELDINVIIYEGDFEEIQEVDSKLVKLAKLLQGKVVTNDYNLNKVCELQGVPVLNINDLSNAVKPVVLPGEEMNVQIIKDGKESNQGVAYLDDGTMIVVEGGRVFTNQHIDVVVTSVLQTSAGRMIFAKPKLLEKAL